MKENTFLIAKQAGASLAKAKQAVSNSAQRAGVAVVAVAGSSAAMADTAADIAAAGVTMLGYATAVVGIMVAFWAVKRGGQKMGWW